MGLDGNQWDWNSMDSMGLNGTRWDSMGLDGTQWDWNSMDSMGMGLNGTPSQLMGGATYLPSSACAAARRTYALRTGGGGGRCLMSLSRNVAISITRELMMEAIRGALNTAHHPRNQCSSSSQSLHIILAINAHHPRNHCTSSSQSLHIILAIIALLTRNQRSLDAIIALLTLTSRRAPRGSCAASGAPRRGWRATSCRP